MNFDTWIPEPTLNFPGIADFLQRYQPQAEKAGVNPLGHYLPPFAYASVQVLGQAIKAVKSVEQKTVEDCLRRRMAGKGTAPYFA